jgi:hypothetical protein
VLTVADSIYLTEEQAAALFDVHRTTLRRSVDAGHLPLHPIFITPHTRRYRRDEVETLTGLGRPRERRRGRP